MIANDVADHQLRDLETQAFGVMTSPGANDVKDTTTGMHSACCKEFTKCDTMFNIITDIANIL